MSTAGLADGAAYYAGYTVINGAGNWQNRFSNGFRIDVKPPKCGKVMDGRSYDRRYVGPSSVIGLIWATDEKRTALGGLPITWQDFLDYGSGTSGYGIGIFPEAVAKNLTASDELVTIKSEMGSDLEGQGDEVETMLHILRLQIQLRLLLLLLLLLQLLRLLLPRLLLL